MRTLSEAAAAFGEPPPPREPRTLTTVAVATNDAFEMVFTLKDVWKLVDALTFFRATSAAGKDDHTEGLYKDLKGWAEAEDARLQSGTQGEKVAA